jgi:hypothetical protein
MRAINNSSGISASTSHQNKGSTDTMPALVYLYEKEIDPNSLKFCRRIAKISHLHTHELEFDSAKASISADGDLTQALFRQALQDPSGALGRIVEIGAAEGLPVTVDEVRDHLASVDDSATRQWLIKARGGL